MSAVQHHLAFGETTYAWEVDPAAAGNVAGWVSRRRETLTTDLAGMATFFPHWILAGALQGRLTRCAACAAPLAPVDGKMRCVICRNTAPADGLLWMGHLPALARLESTFARRRAALRAAGFAEVTTGDVTYLLAPLTIVYPNEWPNVEPAVNYSGRWLDALQLPRYSAAHHLIGNGRACLYSWGQWQATPIHEVLQQRVVNHLTSLLKIAAGSAPHEAFIGRIHHNEWEPRQ